MKFNVTNKIMSIVVIFAIFTVSTYTFLLYSNIKGKMIEMSREEIATAARISSNFVDEDLMQEIKNKNEESMALKRKKLGDLFDTNEKFNSSAILDETGKIILADDNLLEEGLKEGDFMPFDQGILKEESGTSEVYDQNGKKMTAGISAIKNNKGQIEGFLVMESFDKHVKQNSMDILFTSIWKALVLPIAGIFAIYFVISRATKPIISMSEEVKKVSAGDLSFEPTIINSKDEIGALSHSFADMLHNLSDIIGQIVKTESQLKNASGFLLEESNKTLERNKKTTVEIQKIGKGSNDQLFQTKESAAAMDEISSQVVQVAKNSEIMKQSTSRTAGSVQEMASSIEQISKSSQNANKLVGDVQNSAEKGKEHVEESKNEMVAISEIIQDTTKVMKKLGKSSEEIGTIIEVIDSIAEQTNLLALNAAIEAARAGEHGKGFSVVADEVKNLAERSANATKEIANLIQGIQHETRLAVDAIEIGSDKVVKGNKLAEDASLAIVAIVTEIQNVSKELSQISDATKAQAEESNSIVQDINKLEEQVNQVAKATQEQTIGVNEINKAINKISDISQDSSNNLNEVIESSQKDSKVIEDITNSANELEHISLDLHEITQKFKLK